jgi:hypothetical protein
MRHLVICGIFLASLGACRRSQTTPVPAVAGPQASTAPRTVDACRSCRGVWAVHGLDEEESCNCRTTDAGKRCRDGAACQGKCVAAEQPETEVVAPGPPPRGYFIGRCSDMMIVLDCHRIIERGASARGPIPLVEPPPVICQD